MRMNEAVRALIGGSVVYVAMAACSGSRAAQSARRDAMASTGGSGSGGVPESGRGGGEGTGGARDASSNSDSGIPDALTDPVTEAMADTNTSGTRLKLESYAAADGAKEFIGFYDSQLQTECGFRTAADGALRCLPSAMFVGGLSFYADAACTVPLAYRGIPTCPTAVPKYTEETTTTCPVATRVFNTGQQDTGQVYMDTNGSCAVDTFYSPRDEFYTIGAEIPATDFVAATVQIAQ